jgi:hypothetical protein
MAKRSLESNFFFLSLRTNKGDGLQFISISIHSIEASNERLSFLVGFRLGPA